MAYSTGSVVGLDALYDALITFLTGNGWTVAETVATRDKIVKSNGTDGKVNNVFRLSVSTAASNPFKAPYSVHKKFPYLFCQGYGAWTPGSPGTGFQPYGQVGPWAFGGTVVASVPVQDTARVHRYNAPSIPVLTSPDSAWLGRTRRIKTADAHENLTHVFDGRRKVYGANIATNTQMGWSDLSHGEANFSSGGIPPGNLISGGALPCVVHDLVNDKDYVFVLNNTATLALQWLRYDVEANTWATMVAPTWAASATTGGACVWDGNDTIYLLHGNGTTEFAKYTISTNTWTNLAASTVARSSGFSSSSAGCSTNMVYVPNAVSGIGEDVIYCLLASNGTVIYRYDVTANAWRSTGGTGALTAQQTIGPSAFLLWDGIKYLIHSTPNVSPGTWYRSDATSAPNTWFSMGSIQSALRDYSGLVVVNHIPAKVRSHATQNTNYWFLGDADSCVVVVKVNTATPHYYWMQFGRFSSSNRNANMTLTAPASVGGRVTVTVDDTSAYSQGEPTVFWNKDTGITEHASIYDITGPTTFRCNLANAYPTGSRVGLDPTPWAAVGNGMALCPIDPMGNNSDNETAMYCVEPLHDSNTTKRSSPGTGGIYQPSPIGLFNDDNTTGKYGNRGYLKNVGMLSTGAYPAIQAEEAIKVGGKTHLFFPDTETSRYTVDTRGITIGPID